MGKIFKVFLFLASFVTICYGRPHLDRVAKSREVKRKIADLGLDQTRKLVADFCNQDPVNYVLQITLRTKKGETSNRLSGVVYFSKINGFWSYRLEFPTKRFLVKRGEKQSEVVCFDVEKKSFEDGFPSTEKLFSDHALIAEDLSMNFLNLPVSNGAKVKRVQGRDCYLISFKNNNNSQKTSCVEVALEPEFNSILKVERFDSQQKLLHTFQLLNFKKVQSEWIANKMEIKELTDNISTTLEISKAAIKQKLPENIFEKNSLKEEAKVSDLIFDKC